MALSEPVGYMTCPECGMPEAHIKKQKNGRLYRWCADGCNAQFFARTDAQEAGMRKHVKADKAPSQAPANDHKPEPATKRAGFSLGEL